MDSPFGYPVAFGDIIALESGAKAPARSIFSNALDSVFAVMTPACDLIRDPPGAKRVLLMEGERKEIGAVAYSPPMPTDKEPRTIVLTPGKSEVGVFWKTKKLATLTEAEIKNLVAKKEVFIAGRLRSEYALELQQAMLSRIGRVGNMAPMPFNYPIAATVYYPDSELNLVALKTKLSGMCVIGRTDNKKVARIGFDSIQRHDFSDELRTIIRNVYKQSRNKAQLGLRAECINALFTEGFECNLTKASTKPEACKPRLGSKAENIGVVLDSFRNKGGYF